MATSAASPSARTRAMIACVRSRTVASLEVARSQSAVRSAAVSRPDAADEAERDGRAGAAAGAARVRVFVIGVALAARVGSGTSSSATASRRSAPTPADTNAPSRAAGFSARGGDVASPADWIRLRGVMASASRCASPGSPRRPAP
jgi:hypothetical protein